MPGPRKFQTNPSQLPLFVPNSDWRPLPPSEWPDFRANSKLIGVDTETRDPNLQEKGPGFVRADASLVGVSLASEDGKSIYLPLYHEGGDNVEDVGQALAYVKHQLGGDQIKCGANLSYDLESLWSVGVNLSGELGDTQVCGPILDEDAELGYSLDVLAKSYLGYGKDETLLKEAANCYGFDPKKDLWRLPARFVGPYATVDAELPIKIYLKQVEELKKDETWSIFLLERRLQRTLFKMRLKGVRVDVDKAQLLSDKFTKEEENLYKRLQDLKGKKTQLNPSSSEDVGRVLTDQGFDCPRTPAGNFSIKNDWLKEQPGDLCLTLLEWRVTNKMRKDFIDKLVNDTYKGRIYSSWHALREQDDGEDASGTRSGRIASSKFNLTQVPSRHPKWGKMIRSLFIADEGKVWGKNDYCFSADTEVLTEQGFMLFAELKAQKVAQYDIETGIIDFQTPISKQRVQYKGDMVHIFGKKGIDMLVSPNHRCFLKTFHDKIRWTTAKDYMKKEGYQVGSGLFYGKEDDISIREIITSVAVQADGAYTGLSYRLSLQKERKHDRVREFIPIQKEYTFREKIIFKVAPKDVTLLHPGPAKLFIREKIINLSLAHRLFFLKELLFWDGTGSYEKGNASYCTTVKHNAEVVQELAILSGCRSNLAQYAIPSGKTAFFVSIISKTKIWNSKFVETKVPYDGEIFCVTMPKSTVVVRRNGKVMITGQSQQEPRILLHYAYLMKFAGAAEARQRYIDDPSTDYHQLVADLVKERTGKDIGRRNAKDINLGSAYGMGRKKLAIKLGVSLEVASQILDAYHAGVPYVKELEKLCTKLASERGYILTILKRKRRFSLWEPEDREKLGWVRPVADKEKALRLWQQVKRAFAHKALNSLVQGSAADQIKQALINLDDSGLCPQLQVYDELDGSYDGPDELRQVQKIMEEAVPMTVPFIADPDLGSSWGDVQPLRQAT